MADDTEEMNRELDRLLEPLDYSPPSGSVGAHEKSYDESAPHSHDDRALTRTTFYPEQGDGTTDYERLAKVNDGKYSDEREARKRAVERKRDLDVFADTLELTDYQTERAHLLLDSVEDVRPFQSDEVLLLAIVTIVANEGYRPIRRENAFDDLCETCDVVPKQLRDARQQLRESCPFVSQ